MNTTTAPSNQTIELKRERSANDPKSYWARRTAVDWVFALLIVVGAAWAFTQYNQAMNGYEEAILLGTVPSAIWLGWFWRPLQKLMGVVAAFALLAIWLYQAPDRKSVV